MSADDVVCFSLGLTSEFNISCFKVISSKSSRQTNPKWQCWEWVSNRTVSAQLSEPRHLYHTPYYRYSPVQYSEAEPDSETFLWWNTENFDPPYIPRLGYKEIVKITVNMSKLTYAVVNVNSVPPWSGVDANSTSIPEEPNIFSPSDFLANPLKLCAVNSSSTWVLIVFIFVRSPPQMCNAWITSYSWCAGGLLEADSHVDL
jgi:hypothetical protein